MLRWRKLRLEASCSLFIRPSVRTLPHTHTAHLLPKTYRPALRRKRRNRENCDLGGTRALFPVSSNGWTGVAAPFIHRWRFAADGGATLSLSLRGLR